MNKFISGFIMGLCLFSIGLIQAQTDIPRTPVKIEGNNTSGNSSGNTLFNTNLLSSSSTTNNATPLDISEKKNIMTMEEFMDAGERFNKKANRSEENGKMGNTSTQYLGDFKSNGKFVKIVCRDHQYVDGDRVRVLVNDKVVQPNILLTETFKGFLINLEPGFNKIDFQALNQGSSGPNTAAFAVFDDKGALISSNDWNLATGVKATMIVVKEAEEE